jgi:hypothetical protein
MVRINAFLSVTKKPDMKLYCSLIICCICLQFGYGQTTVTQMRTFTFVDAAQEANLFNGVVLVARHDSILFTKGYGWRD